jgi:AraC-like DNA-binding protein
MMREIMQGRCELHQFQLGRQARLLRSLELLSSNMSVSMISDQLGFGEPSAFIAMFRAAFGVTPGRYLAAH